MAQFALSDSVGCRLHYLTQISLIRLQEGKQIVGCWATNVSARRLPGESVIYVTLSESKRESQQVAQSDGWTAADSLQITRWRPPEVDLNLEAQYAVFHPSEVELADTITAIL
jgi:KaiC/GvpD/RAD55 family RecA-like ATPase